MLRLGQRVVSCDVREQLAHTFLFNILRAVSLVYSLRESTFGGMQLTRGTRPFPLHKPPLLTRSCALAAVSLLSVRTRALQHILGIRAAGARGAAVRGGCVLEHYRHAVLHFVHLTMLRPAVTHSIM